MKILIRNNKTFYWQFGDFHSLFGVIKEKDLQDSLSGSIIISNINKEFLVLDASFIDLIANIKRGPAIILPKDIGYILTFTGIDKNSICLDAGTGSGVLTAFLARFAKKVYSYENNSDFFNLAKKNLEFLNIKNIELKNKDVNEVEEKDLDLVVLDLPEPWNVLINVYNSLKPGSFLVTYLPTINQVQDLIKNLNNKFLHEKTIELIEREWFVSSQVTRPKSQMIAHTAFLTFLRKV